SASRAPVPYYVMSLCSFHIIYIPVEPSGMPNIVDAPSLASVTVRLYANRACRRVTVAPGADTSVAPNDPSRFRSKKTVPWAVCEATWKSWGIIQSGTPSPFASAGVRIAWSIVTGRVNDARDRSPTSVLRGRFPLDAVMGTLPDGTIAR